MQEVSVVADRAAAVMQFGQSFLTQTAWYVDSTNGSDENDASALAPIRTLAELERRWTGRVFSPAVAEVSVNLSGSFQTENLILGATFSAPNDPVEVTITGTMTTVGAGTISGYVAWDSAGNVRGALTDAGQDFTPHVRRRIRIDSIGAAQGGVTRIGSLGAGATIANVGQFRTLGPSFTGANVNPTPGDTYVIETFDTKILGYSFRCPGANVVLKDVAIAPPTGKFSYCQSQQMQGLAKIAGCDFVGASGAGTTVEGTQAWISCAVSGPATVFRDGLWNTKGLCVFSLLSVYKTLWQADSTMHDGNGSLDVSLDLELGTTLLDTGFRAIFGCSAVGTLAWVDKASYWQLSSCFFWGAAGNLATVAVKITNGSGVYYTTGFVPKATGVVPGNDVVLSGAAAIAWGAVPAVAAPPNNAVVAIHA